MTNYPVDEQLNDDAAADELIMIFLKFLWMDPYC